MTLVYQFAPVPDPARARLPGQEKDDRLDLFFQRLPFTLEMTFESETEFSNFRARLFTRGVILRNAKIIRSNAVADEPKVETPAEEPPRGILTPNWSPFFGDNDNEVPAIRYTTGDPPSLYFMTTPHKLDAEAWDALQGEGVKRLRIYHNGQESMKSMLPRKGECVIILNDESEILKFEHQRDQDLRHGAKV